MPLPISLDHEFQELGTKCVDALKVPGLSALLLLGVSAACRESVRVFTFRICFMTRPAGR